MFDIPQDYGDNKIVLMVRDPWTIYSYWEVAKDIEDSVRDEVKKRGLEAEKSTLRIYEITPEGEKQTFDFDLRGWVRSWYIHTPSSGKNWVAEIGIVAKTGEFFPLAKSNSVKTPTHSMSDICDEEWMCPEDLYYRLFTYETGTSSFKTRESIEEHLIKRLSSDGVSLGRSVRDRD